MPHIEIPDYEDMMQVANRIMEAVIKRDALDREIKARESEIYRITSTNQQYFVNGKPPSASFVKSAYEFSGLDGELLTKRGELAEVTAVLENLRLQFEAMKLQIDLYRTESANRRTATL